MELNKRKSLILHFDSLDVLDELGPEQISELFIAIRDYNMGKDIQLTGLMKAIFIPFKNQFDRDIEKYIKKCEVNAKNGKTGGRPKKTQENPNGFSGLKNNPEKAYNKNDNKNKNKNKNESNIVVNSDIVVAPKVATLETHIKESFTNEFMQEVKEKYDMTVENFKEESMAFLSYWKEKSPNGKKERWQKEKTFDPKLRFRTWMKNNKKWTKPTKYEDHENITSVFG